MQRTLVKSPPELWAEVSSAEALARHLGAFGEIRITRLEPETTVAWEGERASGTVSLAPSGWGTKVTLTAELTAIEEAMAEVVPAPEPEVAQEPVAIEEPVMREPVLTEEEVVPEVVVAPPILDVYPPPVERPRGGFFARLFGRRPEPTPVLEEPVVAEPEVVEPVIEETVEFDAFAAEFEALAAEPVAAVEEIEAPPAIPDPPSEPPLAVEDAEQVLTSALDSLGAAHHRPFSRG